MSAYARGTAWFRKVLKKIASRQLHVHGSLPAALQNFKIIEDDPAVAALTTGKGDARRIKLESAVAHQPSNQKAVAELEIYIAELDSATKSAIAKYLQEPGLFKRAVQAQ